MKKGVFSFMKSMSTMALMLFAISVQPVMAEGPTILVNGVGDIEVAPDIASVVVKVRTRDKDPEKSQSQNVVVTKKLLAAFEAAGVKRSTMGSSNYTFRRDATSNSDGKIIELGYYAENSIQINLSKFEMLPRIIALAVANGATSIDDVSYKLLDEKPFIDQARVQAFQKAKVDAEKSATAAGMVLGPILTVSLGGAYIPDNLVARRVEGEADMPASQLQPLLNPGTLHVQYNVTIQYQLK
jgi:uncharacterized protein